MLKQVTIEQAIKDMHAEVSKLLKHLPAQAEKVERMARELQELASDTGIPDSECRQRSYEIKRRAQALVDAIHGLMALHPASALAWEACFAIRSLDALFETRAKAYEQALQAEREKEARAAAYRAQEEFERRLKKRLRSGEALDVEAERARFHASGRL